MKLNILRSGAIGSVMVAALVALSACGDGASAVETRDRTPSTAKSTLSADSRETRAQDAQADQSDERTSLTANRRETVDSKIQRLYERNGADFGATSPEDFLARITEFTSHPPPGVETVSRPNGDTLLYQASTNTFAVIARNGSPRTMFKPDEGPAYWAEQKASARTFRQQGTSN
jgi:pyocin large subunit-like protein